MEGYYCDNNDLENPECKQCDHQCATCEISSDNCIDCLEPRTGAPECPCPMGTFDDGLVCADCNYKCEHCDNRQECLTCVEGRLEAPDCACPDGYYDEGITDCTEC